LGMRESYRERESDSYTVQDDPCPYYVLLAGCLFGESLTRF
jgi:hypothetical protein